MFPFHLAADQTEAGEEEAARSKAAEAVVAEACHSLAEEYRSPAELVVADLHTALSRRRNTACNTLEKLGRANSSKQPIARVSLCRLLAVVGLRSDRELAVVLKTEDEGRHPKGAAAGEGLLQEAEEL